MLNNAAENLSLAGCMQVQDLTVYLKVQRLDII